MAVSKNIMGRVVYGDLRVELVAEGASWNPDVADDMIKRLNGMWRASLEAMMETGTWEHDVPVEED